MNDIIKDIQHKLDNNVYTTEEHVRFSLVSRILHVLGWNIWDPSEVNTEFIAVPHEDQTRVDIALFTNKFSPIVFIEIKAVGKLTGNLRDIERQLRDYNRNNTALFSIITDGRYWRFYYSQTGGEFSQKCFKVIDLLKDSIDDIETFLDAFLSKNEVISGNAKHEAESYLKLSRKQRAMEDALPRARRLILEPPFLSLPQALVKLTGEAGYPVTIDEASKFIKEGITENTESIETSQTANTERGITPDSYPRPERVNINRNRFAQRRMSSYIRSDHIYVSFQDGPSESWALPDRKDKRGLRSVIDKAVAFARGNNATIGQINAVRKTFTDANYHLTR